MVPDPTLSINDGAIAAWPGAWAGKNFHDILEELGFPMDTPWQDIPADQREWILYTEEQPWSRFTRSAARIRCRRRTRAHGVPCPRT